MKKIFVVLLLFFATQVVYAEENVVTKDGIDPETQAAAASLMSKFKGMDFSKIKEQAFKLARKAKGSSSHAIEKAVMVEAKVNMASIRKGEEAYYAESDKYTKDISKLSIRPSAYKDARFAYAVKVSKKSKKHPYIVVATRKKGKYKGCSLLMYPDGVIKGTGMYVDLVD